MACSFVLQIRIQKWIQLARVLSGRSAYPGVPRQPTLSFSARHVNGGTMGPFSFFLAATAGETAVNGNPFGDVSAKFPHSAAAPRLNNKEPERSYCNYCNCRDE